MESQIDIFILVIFSFNQLWQIVKILKQYSDIWFTSKFWLVLTHFSVIILSLTELLKIWDVIDLFNANKIQSSCIGLISFNFLAIISLATIKNITSKKVKILWRLPIIGLLIGYYLNIHQLMYVWMVIESLIFLILFLKKEDFRFYFRTNLKSIGIFLLINILLILNLKISWVLLFAFFIYYYFRVVVLQVATLSYWINHKNHDKRNC